MSAADLIFKKGIPQSLRVPLLGLAIFPHLMLLSMFSMNTTFTASFLDLEIDDLQFLLGLAYAAVVCALFMHIRFFQFLNVRAYLLLMTLLNILILLSMTWTHNTQLILVLRLLQGPLILLEGVILIPIIMSQLKAEYARIVAYSILYCYMMTGDKFTTSLVKFAIENYSHNMMIYTMIVFHVLVLLLYLLMFNHNRMFPKKPLIQLNLGGIFLLLICLVSGAYCLVYGKKYEWFDSWRIVVSFSMTLLFGGFFILHQRNSKRPLFYFQVFLSERVVIGIILFFVFYMIRASMNNVYQIMRIVWHWPWTNILQIQYVNVAGSIMGCLLSLFFLLKKIQFRYLFALGFFLLASAMLWFSLLLYPDIAPSKIFPPLFLEGLGQGILFTPLVLYLTGSVHPDFSGSASLVGTAIRFWSTMIGYAVMQNLVLHMSTQRELYLSEGLDPTNPAFQHHWHVLWTKYSSHHVEMDALSLTAGDMKTELVNQSLLLTNIDIFSVLFYIGIAFSVLCFCYQPLKMGIQNYRSLTKIAETGK